MKEIETVAYMLHKCGITCINIFNGKDEIVRPDRIAGLEGAVSLGTNVCGRGTDIIQRSSKHLHVIVSYFSSNTGVMHQAYGRTARQGNKGTFRVICVSDQYPAQPESYDDTEMESVINDFKIKNDEQRSFIDHFKQNRSWIFSGDIGSQHLCRQDIANMREAKINVNRIVAYNYQFPLCMKVDTFLNIQAQRIFSIYNCPNSEYTWILFQRYVREMVLESWSLMINKIDRQNVYNRGSGQYAEILRKEKEELIKKLEKYLPKSIIPSDYDIVPTFMHIHNIVISNYQDKVLNCFNKMPMAFAQIGTLRFASLQIGFKPYSLKTKSGARITYGNVDEMNYIIDPELRYLQKEPEGKFPRITLLSITQRIDNIFNKICQKINEAIGEKIFLKFFLRRTLGGCEYNLLIDKDPLFVFTISVKSMFPILAGILIIVLVYVASIAKEVIAWITSFHIKLSGELAKKGVVTVVKLIAPKVMESILENFIDYLKDVLESQVQAMHTYCPEFANVVENVLPIFTTPNYESFGEMISEKFGDFIKVKTKFGNLLKESTDTGLLVKIGILLLLCLGTFMANFKHDKQALKKDSKDYDSNYKDEKKADSLQEKNKNKANLDAISPNNEIIDKKIKDSFDKVSNTYRYQMEICDKNVFIRNPTEFADDVSSKHSRRYYNGTADISYLIYKTNPPKNCLQLQYYGNTLAFSRAVIFHAILNHPAIVPFIGWYSSSKEDRIYVENKKIFLDDIIYEIKFDNFTYKLIIAYGIACAMELLHFNRIVHGDLKPANILVDAILHPYIYEFFSARQIDLENNFQNSVLNQETIRFLPPEYHEDSAKCCNSFKLDVYMYGMILFNLASNKNPFINLNESDQIILAVCSGQRPDFPDFVPGHWRELIGKCWSQNPEERPEFKDICDKLESAEFSNSISAEKFDKYKNMVKMHRPSEKVDKTDP